MKKEEKIREEVEKTLSAFDKIESIDENPFLFTRIQSEIENLKFNKKGLSLRGNIIQPVILFLILIINIFTAVFFLSAKNETASTNQTYLSAISSEYSINHSYYSQLNKMIGN
jgi:hypothetical protein